MRILVTRPSIDAESLASALCALGHLPILSPVMEVRLLPGAALALDGVQAIVATSANGIRALAPRTRERALPIFAVGPQTAAAAEAAQFTNVIDAGGDAATLALTIVDSLDSASGALLHAAGRDRTGELARRLAAAGFSVRTEMLYEAVALPHLSTGAAEGLAAGEIDAAMFYSPRSARLFADQLRMAEFTVRCRSMVAFCISHAAAERAAALPFAAIRVAAAPNQAAMLALVSSPYSRPERP